MADEIAQAVVDGYCRLSKGKPGVRSNGAREWTVLAGVVAVDNHGAHLVCLATGCKALPDSVREYSRGLMVHDCHAEVLALRALNYYLMKSVQSGKGVAASGKVSPSVQLVLYTSEAPCGDASMHRLSGVAHKRSHDGVVRGRDGYGNLGVVRTKPGRPDSPVTYSMLCLDKLAYKQTVGVCTTLLSTVVEPVFLAGLVMPSAVVSAEDALRCFHERIHPSHPLQLLASGVEFPDGKAEGRVPSPLSVVYIPEFGVLEVLDGGVRQGCSLKPAKARALAARIGTPVRHGGELVLCRARMVLLATELRVDVGDDYCVWKQEHAFARAKELARAELGTWRHGSREALLRHPAGTPPPDTAPAGGAA